MTDTLEATPRNMRAMVDAGHTRCFAYDPVTGEKFSADPGDYWAADPDTALVGRTGQTCWLAVEYRQILPVDKNGDPIHD